MKRSEKLHCLGVVELPVRFPPQASGACPECGLWQRPCACTGFEPARPPLASLWPGDPRGASWGYTFERWAGSFLVIQGDRVICVLLRAHPQGHGHFRALMRGIERSGYRVSVAVPMPGMTKILKHYGFEPHSEDGGADGIDVWEKPIGREAET